MSKPRQLHRVLSVLLCLCMLAGMLPAYALAADSKAAGSSELTKGSSIEGTDYSVTSLKNYAIAPDISEKVIITNNAAGNSQTVANVMEVNTAGGRAKIVAGYGNRNPKEQGWTLKTTTDQAHVYEKETGLNVVGGVNASWFNINTGEPSGYLVMNGVVHHDNSSRAFIAAFDDGSVNVFREGTTLAQAEADQSAKQGKTVKILEAVDALVAMVWDGKVVITESGNSGYYPRTCVGIKADGTVNIGVFSDKNPFGYVDENGEYQGYDVYYARRLGEDLGVDVNFVSTEAANRIEYLQTGKVDVILANFTVTPERAEEVDFASPYMNVSLGVVSKDDNVITSLDNWNADDSIIVISGTTAETYLIANYPDIPLQKFDSYATAKEAFENGTSVAWANDNTEVIAFALQNEGYTVGIPSLGSADTIAPAVSKGNTTLLDWINDEIVALGEENFFHADYEATLADTYGLDYEDSLVVEGGKVNAQ